MREEPSRSYIGPPIPIVTTYEHEVEPERPIVNKRQSVAGSTKAATVPRQGSVAQTVPRSDSIAQTVPRSPSIDGSVRPPTVKKAPSTKAASMRAPSTQAATINRPPSVAGSVRDNRTAATGGSLGGVVAGTGVGQVLSPQRQRELQQTNNAQPMGTSDRSRTSLADQGVTTGRNTTHFDQPERATSPRPQSPFGARPQPNLLSVAEDGRESRYDNGRESRAGGLGRQGTVISRANTLGRNGTMSRATNGGTVGNRRGAFGRGAGASIGTQPEEVLGRE